MSDNRPPATGQQNPPTAPPAPTPPPPPPTDQEDQDAYDAWLRNAPPDQDTNSYIQSLKSEARDHRLKAKARQQEVNLANARIVELQNQMNAKEAKELEENNKWKERFELEHKQKTEILAQVQVGLIDTKIESEFVKHGINPKMIPMLNRSGIIAGSDGKVNGVEDAVQRFMWENKDLLEKLKTPAHAEVPVVTQPTSGQQQTPPPGQLQGLDPRGFNRDPITGMTYEELNKSFANAGKAPAGSDQGQAAPAKPDFSKMTPKAREQWWKDYESKLSRR